MRTPRDMAQHRSASRAFTLIELLVSITVLSVLLVLTTQVIGQMQKTWLSATTRTSQFREARAAFDLITHNLSQAVLNPYWETDNGGLSSSTYATRTSNGTVPQNFLRKSDLQFICGPSVGGTGGSPVLVQSAPNSDVGHLPFSAVFFQATLGVTEITDFDRMQSLLCGRGYFVEYGDDAAFRPAFIGSSFGSNKFRLMEYSPTTERNSVYADELSGASPTRWFSDAGTAVNDANSTGGAGSTPITRGFTRPIAENIIALIIAPRISDLQAKSQGVDPHYLCGQGFTYNSTAKVGTAGNALPASKTNPQGTQNLLPPMVDIIMVALDEASSYNYSNTDITKITGLFSNPTTSSINNDLQTLQNLLLSQKPAVNFRVFKSTVEIKAARWSL